MLNSIFTLIKAAFFVTLLAISTPAFAQFAPEWIQFFASATDEYDKSFKIATDASGYIITAAVTRHSSSIKDSIVLLKYDTSGIEE